MIAAYMTSTDPAVARQIVEGPWWHVMNLTFQDPPSNRHVFLQAIRSNGFSEL